MPFGVKLKNLNSTMNGNFIEETKGVKLKSKYEYDRGNLVFGYDYTATNLKRNSFVSTDTFAFKDAVLADRNTGKELSGMEALLQGMAGNSKGQVAVDTLIDMDKDTHAVYFLNDYKLTNKFNLTTGLRYEYSDYSGNRTSISKMYGSDYKGTMIGGMLFGKENPKILE